MSTNSCTICHSWAINEHLHNRVRGHNSHLCDTCYWEEEAKQYKASHARLVKALEKIAEANCTDEVLNPSMTMFMTHQVATIALAEAKEITREIERTPTPCTCNGDIALMDDCPLHGLEPVRAVKKTLTGEMG